MNHIVSRRHLRVVLHIPLFFDETADHEFTVRCTVPTLGGKGWQGTQWTGASGTTNAQGRTDRKGRKDELFLETLVR